MMITDIAFYSPPVGSPGMATFWPHTASVHSCSDHGSLLSARHREEGEKGNVFQDYVLW